MISNFGNVLNLKKNSMPSVLLFEMEKYLQATIPLTEESKRQTSKNKTTVIFKNSADIIYPKKKKKKTPNGWTHAFQIL